MTIDIDHRGVQLKAVGDCFDSDSQWSRLSFWRFHHLCKCPLVRRKWRTEVEVLLHIFHVWVSECVWFTVAVRLNWFCFWVQPLINSVPINSDQWSVCWSHYDLLNAVHTKKASARVSREKASIESRSPGTVYEWHCHKKKHLGKLCGLHCSGPQKKWSLMGKTAIAVGLMTQSTQVSLYSWNLCGMSLSAKYGMCMVHFPWYLNPKVANSSWCPVRSDQPTREVQDMCRGLWVGCDVLQRRTATWYTPLKIPTNLRWGVNTARISDDTLHEIVGQEHTNTFAGLFCNWQNHHKTFCLAVLRHHYQLQQQDAHTTIWGRYRTSDPSL